MEQVCLAFTYIFGYAREFLARTPAPPVFVAILRLLTKCCALHPLPFYFGLARSSIGMLGSRASSEIDRTLTFLVQHLAVPMASQLEAPPHTPTHLTPMGFDMLAEALRHGNLALEILPQGDWAVKVWQVTLHALNFYATSDAACVAHERAVVSMLRFVRAVVIWPTVEPKPSDEDNGVQKLHIASQKYLLLASPDVPTPVHGQRVVDTCMRLTATVASAGAQSQVIPNTAEILRFLLQQASSYEVADCLKQAAMTNFKLPPSEAKRLVEGLSIEKTDARRFGRLLFEHAENLRTQMKRAQFGQ